MMVQFPKHLVVGLRLAVVGIERKTVWVVTILVSEAPGLEGVAISFGQTDFEKRTVNLGLKFLILIRPLGKAGLFCIITTDFNFSDLSLDSEVGVSFHVLTNAFTVILETLVHIVEGDVSLQTNTVNWAIS